MWTKQGTWSVWINVEFTEIDIQRALRRVITAAMRRFIPALAQKQLLLGRTSTSRVVPHQSQTPESANSSSFLSGVPFPVKHTPGILNTCAIILISVLCLCPVGRRFVYCRLPKIHLVYLVASCGHLKPNELLVEPWRVRDIMPLPTIHYPFSLRKR